RGHFTHRSRERPSVVLGVGPVARLALGPQLLARRGLGVHALVVLAPLLAARGPLVLVETQVRAAATEQLRPGLQRGLPVEDDGVARVADAHLVAGDRARLEQAVLD